MPTTQKDIFAKRTRTTLVCVLLILAASTLAAVGLSYRSSSQTVIAKAMSSDSAAVTVQAGSSAARLEAERVTVHSTGFEPAEINRPAGRFLLAVNDHTGSDGLTLMLARDTGQRLHTTRMRDNPRKHEWRQVVSLPPGRYVLSEANHPEWVCRITLTSN